MAQTATFRAGSGDPLVLLHIGANPWKKWENCLAALTARYDVFVPTLAGFDGGRPLRNPATLSAVTDAVEADLDAAGIDTAHIVGNSLGGWLAMELARRGRARTSIAFSPAGGWVTPWGRFRARFYFQLNLVLNALSGPMKPLLFRSSFVRRIVLSGSLRYGNRISREQALAIARDSMRADPRLFLRLLRAVTNETVQPYPDLGIPSLVVWSEKDRLTPLHPDGDTWRAATPHMAWRIIPDVGHMPMFDDPDAVAQTILEWTAQKA